MQKSCPGVDYLARNDFELISWWWTDSNHISDERILFISDFDYFDAAKHEKITAENKSIPVSWLRLGTRIDIPAIVEIVKMNISDYRYRYVVVSFKNILGDDFFNKLLESVFTIIKEYLPDSVLIWAAIEDNEADAGNILRRSAGLYSNIRDKSPDESFKEISTFLSEKEPQPFIKPVNAIKPVSDEFIINNRESIVWAHIGFNDARKMTDKKRILLVGDSISCYGDKVIEKISDRFTVDFLRTSKGVNDPCIYSELSFIFSQYDYDLVHINNGIHRYGSTVDEYAAALQKVLEYIKNISDRTLIIFATTTTINAGSVDRQVQETDPAETFDIARRNEAAVRICAENGYFVDDLYALDCKMKLEKIDIYHFTDIGYEILSNQVIESIESAFKSQKITGA